MPCAMSSLRGASGVVGCDRLVWSLVLHAIILSHLDVLLCTLLFFFVWCALSACLYAHAVVRVRGVCVAVSALSSALCACSAVVCVPAVPAPIPCPTYPLLQCPYNPPLFSCPYTGVLYGGVLFPALYMLCYFFENERL